MANGSAESFEELLKRHGARRVTSEDLDDEEQFPSGEPNDDQAAETEPPPEVERPAETLRATSLDDAEATLAAPIGAFFRSAEAEAVQVQGRAEPAGPSQLQQLAQSDFGVGKSAVALAQAIAYVQGKHAGSGGPKLPRRVAIIVADLQLADELAERANRQVAGVAVVRRGLDAADPDAPDETMCRRLPDMKAWIHAGGQPNTLCARCPRNTTARYRPDVADPGDAVPCGYKLQSFRDHQVIVMAGPATLTEAPYDSLRRKLKATGGKDVAMPPFDAVIVDEPKPLAWLGGFDARSVILTPEMLAEGRLRPPKGFQTQARRWKQDEWFLLDDKVERLLQFLEDGIAALEPGQQRPVRLGALRGVDRYPGEWRSLRRHVLELIADPPKAATSLEGEVLVAEVKPWAEWNRAILTLAKACNAAAQALEIADGGGQPCGDDVELPQLTFWRAEPSAKSSSGLRLRWREQLADGWQTVPALLLDATAEPELLKRYFPHLELIADTRVALPEAVKVAQVFDKACGYATLAPQPETEAMTERGKERRRSALAHMRRLANTLDVVSALTGQVGVIVPRMLEGELEDHWRQRGQRPDVVIGHHNGIRGSNRFRDVRVLINVSRPSPPPADVEALAEILGSRLVGRLSEGANGRTWYKRGAGRYLMRDGTARAAPKSESHPDPSAERVRRQIVDAELDQGDGRGRGIRRTEATRLALVKITPQPSTRTEVDQLITLDQALPFDEIDALAARGVIVPVGRDNKGALGVLSKAIGLGVEAVRKHVQRRRSTGKITKEIYSYLVILPVEDSSETSVEELLRRRGQWTRWRVKLEPEARYWTAIDLRQAATVEAARAVLEREGLASVIIEAEASPA